MSKEAVAHRRRGAGSRPGSTTLSPAGMSSTATHVRRAVSMRYRSSSTGVGISIRRSRAPAAGFDVAAALIEALAVELGEALLGRQFRDCGGVRP